MSTAWGPEAAAHLRSYVLQRAANADTDIRTVADLSRATGVKPSVFSKWFAGTEQPSVASLQRVAPVIQAPLAELLVLACRVSPDDLSLDGVPQAPEALVHPLARELNHLLGEDSPLSISDRERLSYLVEHAIEAFKAKRTTKRRTA